MDFFNRRAGTTLGYPSSEGTSQSRKRHGRTYVSGATCCMFPTRILWSPSPHSPFNKATGKIRAFFMAILKPIKSSMTTNMQVIQSSVLLKYRPLYTFLQRRAQNVALEFQKSYIAAARVYYETGFRRYTRSLSWIKVNLTESLIFLSLITLSLVRHELSRKQKAS